MFEVNKPIHFANNNVGLKKDLVLWYWGQFDEVTTFVTSNVSTNTQWNSQTKKRLYLNTVEAAFCDHSKFYHSVNIINVTKYLNTVENTYCDHSLCYFSVNIINVTKFGIFTANHPKSLLGFPICFYYWICSWLVEALKQVGNNVSRLSQLTENNNNNNNNNDIILTFKDVEHGVKKNWYKEFQKQKIILQFKTYKKC